MADKNKVEYGIKNLHFATFTEAGGDVTIGAPFAVPGAVSLTLDAEVEDNKFYADNTIYWAGYSDNGYTGSIEVARFTDEFKKQFLGYVELDDGGLGQVKGAKKSPVCVIFEADGDAESRRLVMYNVSLGSIAREYNTTEESIEPTTESIDITVVGDNITGLTQVSFKPDDSAYSTLFTIVPTPKLPATD